MNHNEYLDDSTLTGELRDCLSALAAPERPPLAAITGRGRVHRRRRAGFAGLGGATAAVVIALALGLPGAFGAARRTRERPAPYDLHVLPAGRPVPAGPRPGDLDSPPDLYAESGRGLFLIRALTDHVQLRNHPQRGAIVSFDKILKWADPAPLRVAS